MTNPATAEVCRYVNGRLTASIYTREALALLLRADGCSEEEAEGVAAFLLDDNPTGSYEIGPAVYRRM